MKDLVKFIAAAKAKYTRIELEDGREVVLDRALCRERHSAVLSKYRVPADRSDDLR
jgi:hypothetical protein